MYIFFLVILLAGEPKVYYYNDQYKFSTKAACEVVAKRMIAKIIEEQDPPGEIQEHGCAKLRQEFYDRNSA
jgi:hypothetical protein